MKYTLPVIFALFINASHQVSLNRAGFIDCEQTGSCAAQKTSTNAPAGFVSGVEIDSLYRFSE